MAEQAVLARIGFGVSTLALPRWPHPRIVIALADGGPYAEHPDRSVAHFHDRGGPAQLYKGRRSSWRTQPAISLQIKRLEDMVCAPLFERDSAPFHLTPGGELFATYARRTLFLHDEALSRLPSAPEKSS